MANQIIHKKSSVVTDGKPKLPLSSDLVYGELAINYAKDNETISLKNSDNEIVEFKSDKYYQEIIEENEEIIAASLTDLDERVSAADKKITENNEAISALDVELSNKPSYDDLDNYVTKDEIGGYIYIENFDKENFQNALTLALQSLNTNESAIIDCTYFKGNHTITNGFIINNSVTLIFGDINITYNNINGTNLFTFNNDNISIQGLNRNTDKTQISNGATIFNMVNIDNTLEGYHIKSKGNKNIEIKNITIVGLKTTMGHQYNNSSYDIDGVGGIYIEKEKPETTEGGNTCNNIRIENILITGTKAHGIYIDTPILSSIKNVRISDCGGHGVFINKGTSLLIENVYVSSSNMSGFCVFGSTYISLNNCVSEGGSIGFWVRSSFNVTLISPGVEATKTQGANPWRYSQPITGVYGLNLSTLSSDGVNIPISDVNSDAYGYFRGYGILVSGGKSINIFTPYIKSISETTINSGYPSGTEITNNVKYINITGNAQAIFILNPSFKETSSTISSTIKHEIGVGEEVNNLKLFYNTEQTTLTGTLDDLHYTTENSKRAPVLLQSQTSIIINGRKLITNYLSDTPKEEQEIVNKNYVDSNFLSISNGDELNGIISAHTSSTTIHITSAERTKWNSAESKITNLTPLTTTEITNLFETEINK